jgi:hypothetical protein
MQQEKAFFWKQQREKSDITRMKVQYKLKNLLFPPLWSPKFYQIIKGTMNPTKVAFLEFSLSSKKKSLFPGQK